MTKIEMAQGISEKIKELETLLDNVFFIEKLEEEISEILRGRDFTLLVKGKYKEKTIELLVLNSSFKNTGTNYIDAGRAVKFQLIGYLSTVKGCL